MMSYKPLWDEATEKRIRKNARNMDPQFTGEEIKFCKRCVISNQRPRIVFDDEGVCSACRFADEKENSIDWQDRGEKLTHLLSDHRGGDGAPDIVVPCSGGKDASMVAHRIKHEHNMNPMCATWAPIGSTDIGRQNYEAFIASGFNGVVGHADGITHRKLSRLALEFYGDSFLPFIYGQLFYPLHVAKSLGIELIMLGENGEAEYGGDPAANHKPCWSPEDWDRVYLKSASVSVLVDIGLEMGAITQYEADHISPYYTAPVDFRPDVHWFSYYRKWHPQENYYYASEHTGFSANPDGRSTGTYSKYSSLDDRFDDPHYYMAYIKYGIGRCTSDAAHEIRDGEINRDEAVALVKRYDGEFPTRHQGEFYEYLGIDQEWFFEINDRFMPDHVWNKNVPIGAWKKEDLPDITDVRPWLKKAVWHVEEEIDSEAGHQGTEPREDTADGGAEKAGGSI